MFIEAPAGAASTARPILSFVPPLLPTLVETPPDGDGWIHEVKHDGYRTLVVVEDGRARAFTRNGHDWSDRYSPIVGTCAALNCRSAILDGELVVQDERGISDFRALRQAIGAAPERLVFFAFDLLHLDGRDLRAHPLGERRLLLRDLLGPADTTCRIQFSEEFAGDGAALFAAAEAMGLEGVVSKKVSSRYRSGRSAAWLKTKCVTEGEFVVVGMEPNPGGAPFVLLAREDKDGLAYAGSAFVTLSVAERERFWRAAEALKIPKAAVPELRKGNRKASFVRPKLRVRARHLRGAGPLRHASLIGLVSS